MRVLDTKEHCVRVYFQRSKILPMHGTNKITGIKVPKCVKIFLFNLIVRKAFLTIVHKSVIINNSDLNIKRYIKYYMLQL